MKEQMIPRLRRENELKAAGLLANEIMGDYSTDIAGKRNCIGCFCGDCKWFIPNSSKKSVYTIDGICGNNLVDQKERVADTIHNCEQFKVRYHAKNKRKVS